MAPYSLFRSASRPDIYICAGCALKISGRTARRCIGTKYLAKVADAEMRWQEQALEIKQGKRKSMLTILEERGLVHAVTGTRDEVDRMMTERRVGAYVGIDPTASSLHVGHLLPLMSLFWMYVHGYHTITLVGGATSKIGDPTDRLTSRESIHRKVRTQYMINIHYQLKKLWVNLEAYALKYGYRWEWAWKRGLVNNNAWMNKLPLMEVLQILGPGVRIGPMLAKETVKNKMQKGDGMSFAEFTYPLLQAWDWWHMYNTLGIRMQIGGSDQYGNITAGMDAVKYIAEHHPSPAVPKKTSDPPFGFTVPLLTTSSGAKFGKSAGNAIWLDSELTSTFDLYGYFLRTSDADVGRYLKLFTFIPLEEIDKLVQEHMQSPSERKAQHRLARDFVELVHGREAAINAEKQHQLVFQSRSTSPEKDEEGEKDEGDKASDLSGASALKLEQVNVNNRPKAQMKLPRSLIETKSIGKILFAAGLAESASEGHRLAAKQAVYIGGAPTKHKMPMDDGALSFARIKLWKPEETKTYLIDDNLLILRRGKHNIRVIEVVDDEEYEKSGLEYPGKNHDDHVKKIHEKEAAKTQGQEQLEKAEEEDQEFEEMDSEMDEADLEESAWSNRQHTATEWLDLEERMEKKEQYKERRRRLKEKGLGSEEFEEDPYEGVDPETRVQMLQENLKKELKEREQKLAEKNAPKPKFTGHYKIPKAHRIYKDKTSSGRS